MVVMMKVLMVLEVIFERTWRCSCCWFEFVCLVFKSSDLAVVLLSEDARRGGRGEGGGGRGEVQCQILISTAGTGESRAGLVLRSTISQREWQMGRM